MAITFVGSTTGVGTGASYTVSLSGTLTGGSNTSPSPGDVVIAFTAFGHTASVAPSVSGNNNGSYTGVTAAHQYGNDSWDTCFRGMYMRQGSTVDTTLTITRQNTTTYGGATVVMVWRGVDPDTPIDVTPTTATTNNAGTCIFNCPSIQPTTAGAVIIAAGAGTMPATSSDYTAISGMDNFRTIKGDGSTADTGVAAASIDWTSGAYDPAAVSGGTVNASGSWVGLSMALRPEPPPVYDLDADPVSLTTTVQSADFYRGLQVHAESVSLAIAVQDADLTKTSALQNYELDAQPVSLSLTIQNATVTATRNLDAQPVSLTLTAQNATVTRQKAIDAQPVSLSSAVQDATLLYGRKVNLDAQPISLSVSAQDATLTYYRAVKLDAQPVALSISVADASMSVLGSQAADPVSLVITIQPATLTRTHLFDAQPISLSATVQDAQVYVSVSNPVMPADPVGLQITVADATMGRVYPDLDAQPVSLSLNDSPWASPDYIDPAYAKGLSASLTVDRVMVADPVAISLDIKAASLTATTAAGLLESVYKLLANRQELDPVAGTFTVYDDDGVTPLFSAPAWEDAEGTIPYAGKALRRIDRLT